MKKEEIRYCQNKNCGKIIESPTRKKYCSEVCQTRVSSLNYYNTIKDRPKFKIERAKKNKKLYEANIEERKAKMRVYGLKYYYKKQAEKKLKEEEKNAKREQK